MAVSKVEQQGKEMLSIWGPHSTKHMHLKAPESCFVGETTVTKDTGGPRMTKRTRNDSSQGLKRACFLDTVERTVVICLLFLFAMHVVSSIPRN